MDGFRGRWGCTAGLLGLAGGLLSSTGCFPQATLPVAQPGTVLTSSEQRDGHKRAPKPATCVAFADFQSNAAAEPSRSPQEREQRRDQARRAYQQALKTDPNYVPAYAGLGRLYEAIGDHDRAVAQFQKGLQIAPKDAGLWFELGMCQARHKQWSEALANLQKAATLEPENQRYISMLGYSQARVGQYDASIATFRRVLSEAQARYNVARMLHHNGQDAACMEQLQLALRLQPDLEPAQKLFKEISEQAKGNAPAAAAGAPPAPSVLDPSSGTMPPDAGAPPAPAPEPPK